MAAFSFAALSFHFLSPSRPTILLRVSSSSAAGHCTIDMQPASGKREGREMSKSDAEITIEVRFALVLTRAVVFKDG